MAKIINLVVILMVCFADISGTSYYTSVSDDDQQQVKQQSLYEQYCCKGSNRGKSFKLSEGKVVHFLFCPLTLPSFCWHSSCSDVLLSFPNAASGYYNIKLQNGSTLSVYCEMDGANCDGEGGWIRVAHFNMTEDGATCPDGLYQHDYSELPHPVCGRSTSSPPGCSSSVFMTFGIEYSKVCGRVRGYQKGTPDGIRSNQNINGPYVDGVSIVRSQSSTHIWTFICAWSEQAEYSWSRPCPCSNYGGPAVPAFVGTNYSCESGSSRSTQLNTFYGEDPLWDGQDCNAKEVPCCSSSTVPWFTREFDAKTQDDIDFRVCRDELYNNEDITIDMIELFVK